MESDPITIRLTLVFDSPTSSGSNDDDMIGFKDANGDPALAVDGVMGTVPEPAILGLLALGGLALLCRRRIAR